MRRSHIARSLLGFALLATPAFGAWTGAGDCVQPPPVECPCSATLPGEVGPNYDYDTSTDPDGTLVTTGGVAAWWNGTAPEVCFVPFASCDSHAAHKYTWGGDPPSQVGALIVQLTSETQVWGLAQKLPNEDPSWWWDSVSNIQVQDPTLLATEDGQSWIDVSEYLVPQKDRATLPNSTAGDAQNNNQGTWSRTTRWDAGQTYTDYKAGAGIRPTWRAFSVDFEILADAGPGSGDNCTVSLDKHQMWFTLYSHFYGF